jgi:hypothetical protein
VNEFLLLQGTMEKIFHTLWYLARTIVLQYIYYLLHFTDEETNSNTDMESLGMESMDLQVESMKLLTLSWLLIRKPVDLVNIIF